MNLGRLKAFICYRLLVYIFLTLECCWNAVDAPSQIGSIAVPSRAVWGSGRNFIARAPLSKKGEWKKSGKDRKRCEQ